MPGMRFINSALRLITDIYFKNSGSLLASYLGGGRAQNAAGYLSGMKCPSSVAEETA